MKKFIVRLLIALVVVVILAVLAVGIVFGQGHQERGGNLRAEANQSGRQAAVCEPVLLSGAGTIKGLVVGNPAGFKTPSAINVGAASLVLEPSSLLSDKIVIKSIKVQGPEITFETNLKDNNLSKISQTWRRATGGGAKSRPNPRSRRNPRKRSRPRNSKWMSLSSPAARFT